MMNITSNETMLFVRKDDDGKIHYRTGLSNKKQDGTYDKAYIDVRMPKGTELPDRTKITIKKGFLTFFKPEENRIIWYIVVQEYSAIAEVKVEQPVYTQTTIKTEGLDDLPLPF